MSAAVPSLLCRGVRSALAIPKVAGAARLTLVRHKTHHRTGAIKPMPKVLTFGFVGVFASVIPGLFIGAAISKSVANFLEENDLFVPSDDDDDDED